MSISTRNDALRVLKGLTAAGLALTLGFFGLSGCGA